MKNMLLLAITAVLLSTGCSSSKITTSWKATGDPRQYNKIMVLGMIPDRDRGIRERMENHMVDDLKELGYSAISSLQAYGPKAFDKMTETDAISAFKNSGIDAVITIILLDKERERNYVPPHPAFAPSGIGGTRFWDYQSNLHLRVYEPGYYVTNTKYYWESNLYDMNNQQLVYSAQTKSFDPSSNESLGHEYGYLIVRNMLQQNILKRLVPRPTIVEN